MTDRSARSRELKDDLVDEAKSADVEGAGSMTKAELADALAARMRS